MAKVMRSFILICCFALTSQLFGQFWIQKASLGAVGRHRGTGCATSHRGYMGLGHVNGRAQHLKQVDGRAVGAYHLILARADQRGQLVAQALGQVKPACGVPRFDEVCAPFAGDHIGHARGGGLGGHAQRVAVQVDHARGQGEVAAQRREGVLRVERAAVLQGGGHGDQSGLLLF